MLHTPAASVLNCLLVEAWGVVSPPHRVKGQKFLLHHASFVVGIQPSLGRSANGDVEVQLHACINSVYRTSRIHLPHHACNPDTLLNTPLQVQEAAGVSCKTEEPLDASLPFIAWCQNRPINGMDFPTDVLQTSTCSNGLPLNVQQ